MPARQTDDVSKLYAETGIDLSGTPPVMTTEVLAEVLAPVMGKSVAALANDRYRRIGIPYAKYGNKIRYLRADVARYLLKNRNLADV